MMVGHQNGRHHFLRRKITHIFLNAEIYCKLFSFFIHKWRNFALRKSHDTQQYLNCQL